MASSVNLENKSASGEDIDDTDVRNGWELGSKLCFYSNKKKQWLIGEIIEIFDDPMTNQEWFHIGYREKTKNKRYKRQRFSEQVRPITINDITINDDYCFIKNESGKSIY